MEYLELGSFFWEIQKQMSVVVTAKLLEDDYDRLEEYKKHILPRWEGIWRKIQTQQIELVKTITDNEKLKTYLDLDITQLV